MRIVRRQLTLRTQGDTQVVDVTPQVEEALRESGIREGQATVFVVGSTAGVTTCEYEPGLVQDLQRVCENLIPRSGRYAHNRAGEDNGHAHLRASWLGASLTVPVVDGRLALGTWQQIVLLDFGTRPRHRTLIVQFLGT